MNHIKSSIRLTAQRAAYRIHDQDSLFFNQAPRLTCRNGETEHGAADDIQ